ncbi:hypothetical protein ACFL57_04770 [Candidatus Margulisiibacteriota bacterium]
MEVHKGTSDHGSVEIYDGDGNLDVKLYTNGASYFNGGSVGIGTTSPQQLLHVHRVSAADSGYIHLTNGDSGSGANDGLDVGYAASNVAAIWNRENTNIVFGTNDTHRMTIENGGNVGIGTETPKNVLDLGAGSAGRAMVFAEYVAFGAEYSNANAIVGRMIKPKLNDSGLVYSYTGTCTPVVMGLTSDGDVQFAASANASYTKGDSFDPNTATKMIIKNNGNVGIGETNPQYKLTIGPSTSNKMGFYADATHYSSIELFNPSTGAMNFDQATGGTGGYHWQYGGKTKVSITSGGRIGIGTTNPTRELDVSGNMRLYGVGGAQFAISASDTSSGLPYMVLRSGVNTGSDVLVGAVKAVNYSQAGDDKSGSKIEFKTGTQPYYGEIAFSTNDTDSTQTEAEERMRIDQSGKVGIGTTAPVAKLHSRYSADSYNPAIFVKNWGGTSYDTYYNALTLWGEDNDAYTSKPIMLTFGQRPDSSTIGDYSDLRGGIGWAVDAGLSFHTIGAAPGVASGQNVRMIIDNTGNVGIGTTNPDTLLHVEDTGATTIMAKASSTGQDAYVRVSEIQTQQGGYMKAYGYDNLFHIGTSYGATDNNVITIPYSGANTGKVGIGTTDIYHMLTVAGSAQFGKGATTGNSQILLGGHHSPDNSLVITYDNDNNYARLNIYGDFSPAGLTIANGGDVGIGTTAPDAKLHIVGESFSDGSIYIDDAKELIFADTLSSHHDAEIRTPAVDNLAFETNNTEAMRIDENGNVGIGTTEPGTKKLYVNGDQFVSGEHRVSGNLFVRNYLDSTIAPFTIDRNKDGARQQFRYLNADTTNEIGMTFWGDGSTELWIGSNLDSTGAGHSNITQANSAGPSWVGRFNASNTDTFRIGRIVAGGGGTVDDLLTVDPSGNVGIGTTDPGAKLDVADTSAGELLTLRNTDGNYGIHFMVNDAADSLGYGLAGLSGIRTASNEHFAIITGGTPVPRLIVEDTGNVGIGTVAPSTELEVIGTVSANAYYADGAPADYVFEADYDLKSIEEQAAFMWANKHLPALKGTEELGGKINIAERLEQAVEELEKAHVYIEQMNKSDIELKAENISIKAEIAELKAEIEALKNR